MQASSKTDGRLLRADQAAKVLACSARSVHRLGRSGRLSRVRVPHVGLRYLAAEVAALVESSRESR